MGIDYSERLFKIKGLEYRRDEIDGSISSIEKNLEFYDEALHTFPNCAPHKEAREIHRKNYHTILELRRDINAEILELLEDNQNID